MRQNEVKNVRRVRRVLRVRKRVRGTPERPRLCVERSNKNIYVQIVDDTSGRTLCSVSTLSPELRSEIKYGSNVKAAASIGKAIAEKARTAGIQAVCFDRRGRKYHGRIKALADAARLAGLKF